MDDYTNVSLYSDWIARQKTDCTGIISCSDGLHNGDESGVDCGGSACPPCETCEVDCQGLSCSAGACQPAEGTGVLSVIIKEEGDGPAAVTDFVAFVQAVKPLDGTPGFPFWEDVIQGTETGVAMAPAPGPYNVGQVLVDGYTPSFSPECFGFIEQGESKTCIITNVFDG